MLFLKGVSYRCCPKTVGENRASCPESQISEIMQAVVEAPRLPKSHFRLESLDDFRYENIALAFDDDPHAAGGALNHETS